MLSIIICTLNEEQYLPKLLESLKLQSNIDFETIIVDAGSEDGTSKVIEFYQKSGMNIKFIPLENQRNISLQRNTGAQNAKNELLLFLDADVILPKDFLKNSLSQINKEGIKVAGTKVYASETAFNFRSMYWMYSHLYLPGMRIFKPIIHGCSIFSTKEIHNKIGGFNQGIIFEDYRYGVDAKKYYRPKLLNTFVRTSARRFYNGSSKGQMELLLAGVYSIFRTGIPLDGSMKTYHENTGHHPKPKY